MRDMTEQGDLLRGFSDRATSSISTPSCGRPLSGTSLSRGPGGTARIGLALVGVPGVVFLTVATFILTLLPLVGAFGVCLPVSGYLLAIGRLTAAVLLFVYGSLVSASDLYLRPAIINRSGAPNVATIVVRVVLFGPIGLLVGPVVLGGATVVLDLFAQERVDSTTG